MALINKDYFIGEINIAQLSQTTVQSLLTVFINKREPEYLEMALGYAFAQEYAAGLAAEEPDQKWIDLRDGVEYTNKDGYTKKWKGFTNSVKQSPIANYTYYWFQRDNTTFSTGNGEKEGKSDNANNTGSMSKQARAWNEMVEQTKSLHDFLLNKKDGDTLVYDTFDIEQVQVFEKINMLNI
jgi:L-rhamnose mutarotase